MIVITLMRIVELTILVMEFISSTSLIKSDVFNLIVPTTPKDISETDKKRCI